MKHLTLIYILCVAAIFATSFSSMAQVKVRWSPRAELALGTVDEGQGVVERKFTAINTGEDTWQVVRSYTSCGCTTVQIAHDQVVRSGDSTLVAVRFDPKGKAGPFREVATVQLSDGENTFNEKITLTGEVRRSKESLKAQFPVAVGEVRLSAAKLDFGELKRSAETKRHLVVCNTGSQTRQITLRFASSQLSLDGAKATFTLAPDETLDLPVVWRGRGETRWGSAKEVLTLTLDSGEKTEVQLLAILLPDVQATASAAPQLQVERRIALSGDNATRKVVQRIAVQNAGTGTLQVLRAYSELPEVEIKTAFPLRIEPGKKQEIMVHISPSAATDFPITLISTDVKKPRQTVRIYKK